jgi:WD40 repeat protein
MRLRHTLPHDDGVTKLVWHATEPIVYTISADKITRVWDARSGQLIKAFRGHRDVLFSLAVSKDGKIVLSGGDDHAHSFLLGMVLDVCS